MWAFFFRVLHIQFLWQKRLGKLIKNASYFCFHFLKCCLSSRRSLQSSTVDLQTFLQFLHFFISCWQFGLPRSRYRYSQIQLEVQAASPWTCCLLTLFFTLGLRLFLPVHCSDSNRIFAHFFVLSGKSGNFLGDGFSELSQKMFSSNVYVLPFLVFYKWEFLF